MYLKTLSFGSPSVYTSGYSKGNHVRVVKQIYCKFKVFLKLFC